jgi:hypothetical protein
LATPWASYSIPVWFYALISSKLYKSDSYVAFLSNLLSP